MKKIFYVTILTFLLMPFVVKAETNVDEIYNSISEDRKIVINSVPLEYYKNTKYYDICIERNDYVSQEEREEQCIETIFHDIVTAEINKTVKKPNDVWVYAGNCDIKNNTCDIMVDNNRKTFNVEFRENPNEKMFKKVEKIFDSMKGSYTLNDLAYINQLINYGDISGFFNDLQNNSKIFNIYPEIKKDLEKNPDIEYASVFGGGGGGPTSYGAGGTVVAFYDGVAIGITEIGYTTYRTIFIPDTTTNTHEEYIRVALDRIKKYINDDNYNIEIVYDEQATKDFCNNEWEECVLKNVVKKDDRYTFDIYKITINGQENFIGIVPIEEKNIKKLEIKSTSYLTGINVETESSDVPLDTSVKAEDITHNHKGFLKAYDIDLYSGIKDEYITNIKDGIIVRIPMEDDFNKEYVDIYHIKEDGKKGDKYKAQIEEIDGKKYAVFTTNHFSVYAIEDEVKEEIKNPNTYDGISSSIFIGIISLIGLICSAIYLKKDIKC